MIAKRVSRAHGKDAFRRLGLYIMGERPQAQLKAAAGGGWRRIAAYALDLQGGGSRVGAIRISNCAAAEPADAIAEIQAVQARNIRAKGDKTYHLVVSFPPGECPTPAQLHDIEDELCAAIGLSDHQRISAVHTDTDHLHIHVAINKVHAATRRCIEPYYDKAKLMAACDRLEVKHGLARTNHGKGEAAAMRGRGADMEAHSGQEALASWIRSNALADIQACLRHGASWQDLHLLLAAYDLAIKPRGAGLVLTTGDGTIMVRASRFSRALSLGSLAKRWGGYESLLGERPAARCCYERQPKRRSVASANLWTQYQDRRQAARAARALLFDGVKREATVRWHANETWKAQRQRIIHEATDLTATGRAALWSKFQLDAATADRAFMAWRRSQRVTITQAHPLPTWFGFLREKAAEGNLEALAILREHEDRQLRATEAFARTADEQAARDVVFSALRPIVRKNGQVVYTLRDGGRVIDSRGAIRVETFTPQALFLTLSLQTDRAPDKTVALGGDATFQQQMVEMAAQKKMALRFAAPELERRRLALLGEAPQPDPLSPGLLTRLGRALAGEFGGGRT